MKVNGKSKTPITAAQAKKKDGESGGTKARTSQQTSKKKLSGVKTAVLDRISDGILAFDAGMNYTYLNERAGELLGRSAQELIGKNLGEEYSGAGRTPFMEACQRALETQSVVWLNEYFPATDRWLEGRVYPSEDGVSVLFTEGNGQRAKEQDRYRILVESMQEAFFLADVLTDEQGRPQDYRFVDVNAAMEQLLGKSRIQILGQAIRELLPLTDRDINLVRQIAAVGLGGEPFFIDEYSESMQRWFRSHFFSPQPGQVSGMSLDITTSRQAEERIREISLFPEQNPNPVMRLTREGRILYANQASGFLLTAWEEEQYQAESFRKIRECLEQTLETGSNQQIEIENEGRVFNCLLVPFAANGYVNIYFQNITERKQAEEALRAIVDQASAGIVRTDPQAGFTFVNQAFCDMLGYSEAELSRLSIWDVTDREILEKNRRLFEHMLATGEGYQLEKRLVRRGGTMFWVSEGTSALRDADGRIRGATSIIVDISRRKRAEESLLDGARRSLFLSSLSDSIRSIENPSKIQVEAACLVGAHLKASRVAYVEVDSEDRFLVQDHYVEGVSEMEGEFSISDFVPQDDLPRFRAGRLFSTSDVKKDARFHHSQRSKLVDLSIQAQMIVPFTRDGRVVAALLIQQAQPRAWKDAEVSLVEEAAERMQAAIERAQVEGRLHDSEKRFRILANTVPSIVWTATPDGRLLYVNDRWHGFTGIQRQGNEPLWTDLKLHPQDAPNFFREMNAIKSSQSEAVTEVRIQRQDGVYRWFQTRSVPTKDEYGMITAWHGVLTDIHDRVEKEAEQRKIIDSTPFMLARCSRDLRYLFVSRAYAEKIGTTPEQLLGRPIVEVMGEQGLETIQPYVDQVLQGQRVEFETRVPFKDFDTPFLHVVYTPERDEQGNIVGWFASIVDLTERRRMEDSLRESERKFNIIFNKLPFTAVLLRPEDNIIVDINEEFETVFGYTRQEVIGKTTSALGIDTDLEGRAHVLAELQVNVAIRDMELQLHTRSLGPRNFLINTDLVNIGRSTYVLQTAQDITGRKRAEQELAEFARQQGALYRLADKLSSAGSLEEMFNPALDAILSALQCDRASILLFDEQDVMSFVAWRGLSDEYRQATNGHSPWTRAEKNARPIGMEDVATADLSDSLRAVIQAEGIGALAFIPLISRGNLIGKFMVYFNKPHTFEEAEIGLAQTIAHQLASHIERKRAAEEVRQSKQRLTLTYHHAPVGIVETTLDGHFLEVNDELCRMLGYTYDELIKLSIADVTQKDYLEKELELYQQLVAGAIPSYRMEKQFLHKDGGMLWGEVVRTMVHDEYGSPLYGIGGVLNITERKQREEEIRARTEEIEALMEVSPIGIFFAYDPECSVITANPSGYHLVEMPEESTGNASKSAPEHARPTYRVFRNGVELKSEELPMQAAARLGMEIEEETLELRFENGTQKYIYAYAKPLFDSQGKTRGAIAAMLDVTERKQAEESLRQSEERFARFMLHLPGLAWIKDIQGHYVFANAEAQKAFKASQEELYGKTDWEIFTPEIAAQFNRNDDLAVLEEKGIQVVETLPQGDGVVHHSLVTKFPIPGPDGRPNMIGGTAFDITERIQMEDALKLARTQAEKTAYRVTQLQKITAALSQAATTSEIAQMVVEQGAPVVGSVGSSILLVNEESQAMEMMYSSMDEAVVRPFARFPLSLNVPASDAVKSGQPVWIASQEEYFQRYPHLMENIQKWGLEAALVFPMIYKGRVLGALTLSFSQPRPFSLEDQEYLLTLARQAAQAIERARVEAALRLDAAMMENVPAGIYLVRANSGIILHTNPQLDKLFGYEPGEIIGKPVSVLNASNGHSDQDVADGIIEILNQNGSWQGEVLSIRKDGTSFWCSASITTFEHDTYGTVWVAARQDITRRKQIEEALRESEQRSSAIVSQATAGIVRKDEGGRLLFVNQAFCDMLGMSEAELKGRRIWELTHPEDVSENKRLYNRLIAEGIPFHLEKRLINKQGSVLWVNVSVSPVVDVSGKPNSAVSVYVDITGRKLAEKRLSLLVRVSELAREFEDPDELMYAVAQAVGEHFQARRTLFNEVDLENNLEIIHRDYCIGVESVAGVHPITDYSSVTTAEMIAGKTVVNRDSKVDPRTAADYERSYVEHGERAYVTVPLMQDGRWVASLWLSDDKPRDWDREEVSLVETIAERTWIAIEKMRVDRALRDSEERLRVTFNTTVVGFATLTPEGNFVDFNDAYCRIVGYSRQELLKLNSDSLTHPDFIEETRRLVAQLLAGEVPDFTVEKIYIRRDGTEIWVQNSVSIVRDENGDPLHLIAICQDITDRKRSERALQESNQRYQTLVEISPYAIFVNKDGRIVFANNECVKLLGAESLEQVIGRPNFDFLHPDYHDIVRERNKLLMQGNEDVPSLEEKIIRFDGEIVDVEISASPFIEQGEPAILVTMNNITERKRAEEALHQLNLELEERVKRRTIELQVANEFLRESEATSRLILESMPDAIVIIDRDGQIVHANTQVETLFGYAPGEVMGQPVETLVPQRFRTEHEQQRFSYGEERNRRIMGLGQELFGRRKDESEFPVEVMLAPIDNSTNWDVLVAIRDNTRQRQAQEALRTNEEKLRTLFEILPVGISFLGKDGRINELNSALAEILGLPRREIQSGKYRTRRFIRADGSPMPASEFASTRARVEQKTIYNVETGIVKEDGEIIWTSVNAAPVQVADVEAAIVTIDITERKKAEEALHRNRERLRILSRRLVEVQEEERHAIARELHDRVGQNLAALTLNLNILRNQLSGEILEKIGTRLNDSVTLVNDILTITRSVMADLRPNVLDDYGLDAAINEYAERFTQRYGIRVITHTPVKATPRLDPGVEMTLLRIAQEALTNIAKHAQASQAVMTLEMEDDAVLMTVEDNGQGIMSWQKVNQPGSHGLRIMRERAEAFGGSLKIHSTYRNGTKIEVKIPLASSSVQTNGRKEKK